MTPLMNDAGVAAQLHDRGHLTWEAAHRHPMILEIGGGTLPRETFRFYFEQNVMYLEDYARAIAFILAKAPDIDTLTVLGRFLQQIVEREIPANLDFLSRLGGAPHATALTAMQPVNYGYTRHLLFATSQDSPAIGLTAILPCQWSYGEIASRLIGQTPKDPIYAEWISLFANPAYDALVADSVTLLDRLAGEEGLSVDALAPTFDWSSRFELAFWQMAYSQGRDNALTNVELDEV
jgi:thiaminase/transcriptional activator TenA